MSATVAATTVETATTVEAATAAHCAAPDCHMSSAATEPAANCAASCEPTTSESAAVEAAPKATSAPTASAPAAAEPRTRAEEDAAGEPARTVVTVRRTSVGVVSIVAEGANGSCPVVARSDADANHHALGAGVRCQGQGSSKYRKNHEIFDEMFHFWAPSEPVKPFCL
jgi:hypothetical protein